MDYFLQKDAVSIRIGEIIGILLLLLVGSALSRIPEGHMGRIVRDWPIEIGGASLRPGQWLGDSHTYSEEATYPLEHSMPIRIENSYGLVSIAPGSDGEIRVRLKKVIYGSESSAKNLAGEIHLQAAPESKGESSAPLKPEAEPGTKSGGDYFVVRTNREALNSGDSMFNTDMEVVVPKNSHLQVRNTFGDVRVAEINGKLDLSTTHRSLEVRDCTGQFTLSTRYGECRLTNLAGNLNLDARGMVYIEAIKGDVTVTDEYSPLEILNVAGKLTVSATEGNLRVEKVSKPVVIDARGTQVRVDDLQDSLKVTTSHRNVDISNVASDVGLESRYATVTLKNIKGNIDISSNSDGVSADDIRGHLQLRARGSGVRVNGIKGPLDIQTTLRDVIVNDFADSCTITNEYAAVSLSTQNLGRGDVNVKDRNGNVDVFLPEGAAFLIDATARNGNVESDYPGLEPVRNANGGVLKSRVKTGGPKILLETDFSNIRIYHTRGGEPDRMKRDEEARAMRVRMPAIMGRPAPGRQANYAGSIRTGVIQ
jgi:DUF4097 and DUF4098 domain-containing protein YvlB